MTNALLILQPSVVKTNSRHTIRAQEMYRASLERHFRIKAEFLSVLEDDTIAEKRSKVTFSLCLVLGFSGMVVIHGRHLDLKLSVDVR